MMKRILSAAALLFAACMAFAGPVTIKPAIKSSAPAFAVIIDENSYNAVKDAVLDYRDAVEADGLATYIVVSDWKTPEEVKAVISDLYSTGSSIEGVMLAGNIPIALVRDAQHLASAFKMDQEMDWKESSIVSDRFYDDFDLKFNFIKQDEDNKDWFYYSLDKDSAQRVSSDIYSSRVHPFGPDAADKLARFFRKAAAEHRSANRLDNMFVFHGHGYNSEAHEVRSGEQMNLREQLPDMFRAGSSIRFADYEFSYPMKYYLLEQLRRDNLDVALLHHHGAEDQQYINGSEVVNMPDAHIRLVKKNLRARLRRAKDKEAYIKSASADLGVPESWFEDGDSLKAADEQYDYDVDIHTPDVEKAEPNCRFVMLDACYNGSFYDPNCIANAYIFGSGKTVAVQGNTVNSLQDRLPDRYIGLLGLGARLGQLTRLSLNSVETHLVGDPTLSFAVDSRTDVNAVLNSRKGVSWWKKYLKSSDVELRNVALRKLQELDCPGMDQILSDAYDNSDCGTERLEALTLMADKNYPSLEKTVKKALSDNCEIVRRMATIYVGGIGDPDLAPALAEAIVADRLSKREIFHEDGDVNVFEPDVICAALESSVASHPEILVKKLSVDETAIRRSYDSVQEDWEEILDPEAKMSRRRSDIRFFRNYNYHYMIPKMTAYVLDKNNPEELRRIMVEAFGWFRLSYRVSELKDCCNAILSGDYEQSVKDEAQKTLNRF